MSPFKKVNLLLILLTAFQNLVFGQAAYNNCDQALALCPQKTEFISNIGADKSLCNFCEDDFTACFTPNNTIWMTFETNATGGDVNVTFSNLQFQVNPNQGNQIQATVFEALAPCDGTTYTAVGTCVTTATNFFNVSALGLNANTTYYVVVNGAKNGGATIAAEVSMNVDISGSGIDRLVPFVSVGVFNDTLCQGETYTFYTLLTNCSGASSFNWYINGDLVAVSDSTYFETSAIQNGDIVTVSNSCFGQCPVEVSASTMPLVVTSVQVNAGIDTTIKQGESVQLNGTTNGTSYSWSPAFSLSSPSIQNPIAVPDVTTTYTLTATLDGCSNSDAMTVFVDETLEITNTFTPNGDGYNDTWKIPALDKYPNCLVQIFDRWGQMLYQTTGYGDKKAWDGTSKGKPMEASVYFYVIEVRNSDFPKPIRGSITLVR
ncbi:MAG: gliding motility-associated C-terminal domain-containing protein [Crocinitomicaceae bacterium]|nr:gliding motility-associated C-terminal domain-containing protein [Crocinitomicaceae bacterium]